MIPILDKPKYDFLEVYRQDGNFVVYDGASICDADPSLAVLLVRLVEYGWRFVGLNRAGSYILKREISNDSTP